MKKYFLPALRLTGAMLILCVAIYTLIMFGIAQLVPNYGKGKLVADKNGNTYFENIGQRFDRDIYFHSRPSAVDYNAAGSGGSNKGPDNTEYLNDVQKRITDFKTLNPKSHVPVDMVTASGSGLDPHISVEAAIAQAHRVAIARGLDAMKVRNLVNEYTENNPIGPEKVNVLKINIALDKLEIKK